MNVNSQIDCLSRLLPSARPSTPMLSILFGLLTTILFSNAVCAGDQKSVVTPSNHSAERLFLENKGQIGDQYGRPNLDVLYLIVRSGLNIQLKANSFSYDSYVVDSRVADTVPSFDFCERPRKLDTTMYRYHRVDVELVGSNPSPIIEARGVSSDYLNVYSHLTEQQNGESGAAVIHGYSRVVYHEIWPGIDLEWLIDCEGNPEYHFIVRPGGDLSSIQLRYHGAQKTELLDDAVIIVVDHGPIKERIPKSYYAMSDRSVNVRYEKRGKDIYGFALSSIDMASMTDDILVIDPTPQRLWGTYYGGAALDWSYDVAVSSNSDIFITGRSESAGAIATAGSHQAVFAGVSDAIVAKFNSSGVRQWGTYLGGAANDLGEGIAVTASGDCIVVGMTASATGIATAGAHQATLGGGEDAFFVKLNGAGVRQWGSYYGGNLNDYGYKVAVRNNGEFVLVGSALSANAIATVGSHQPANAGGNDGFVVKFNDSGVRQWATYYGGSNDDVCHELVIDNSGGVVTTGYTSSTNGIATAGSYQPTYAGGSIDGYIVKFDVNGAREWATYYGGTLKDVTREVSINSAGEIVVEGRTSSTAGIASTGSHQEVFGGGPNDAFIVKLSETGVRQWATYYGGSGDEYAEGMTVLPGDVIVMVGSTLSSSAISTADSYQSTYGGVTDAFLVKFNSGGIREWGTYYGGSNYEFGGDVTDAIDGNIVVVGRTMSTNAISTAGSHQLALGGNFDAFLAKFGGVYDAPVITGTEHRVNWASDTILFSNGSVNTKLTSPNAKVNQLPSESGTLALTTYTGFAIGSIVLYSGTAIPTGFVKCDGQTVSRTTYSKLFEVIGTRYGNGNGSTTFALPNMSHPVLSYAVRYE